jgi:hypothetical protein
VLGCLTAAKGPIDIIEEKTKVTNFEQSLILFMREAGWQEWQD